MVALLSLNDEERDEMIADLKATRAQRAAYAAALNRIFDKTYRAKLRLQVAACDRWIAHYERELAR